VLGFDEPEQYPATKAGEGYAYYGSTVGRFANRITGAAFELDGETYKLNVDLAGNSLHGGKDGGWDCKAWHVSSQSSSSITFTHVSPDGEGGFPGTVEANVTYSLTDDGLSLDYSARLLPDSPKNSTIVSLTNHSYFDLSGMRDATVDKQQLKFSDAVTGWLRRSEQLGWAPSGEIVPIAEDPDYDFRKEGAIGARRGGDFDDYFLLDQSAPGEPCVVATCLTTGIEMSLTTTEPGFQLYVPGGNTHFKAKKTQGGSTPYMARAAVCLEASRFPDAINKSAWRNQVILKKGEEYKQTTVYRFRTV
jgi:aldose 1-epimerase